MFDKKVNSLLKGKSKNTFTENTFIKNALKISAETLSCNGALKYSTSGDDFVDDFVNISRYKEPRSFQEVSKTMQKLWSIDPTDTIKLALYIRLITRKSQLIRNHDKAKVFETQKGQGLRHEGIMRMLWLAINYKAVFLNNIPLYISAGSWKDLITMLNLDLQYHGWKNRKLNWYLFSLVIRSGLSNPNSSELVKKYLPTIRTNSKCKTLESQADTIIGRWLAKEIFPGVAKNVAFKQYRKLKSSGNAHIWQQQISQQLFNEIKFDTIAGRALQLIVNSKFLQNHNLRDNYLEWIQSKSTAKYTGFVFELFKPIDVNGYYYREFCFPEIDEVAKATINAQFAGLVQTANVETNFLVARDISGSMSSNAVGCNMSSYSIAKAMALYFSEFLNGPFANSYVEFADECRLKQWKGNTIVDKWLNDNYSCIGSTNFLSIAILFARLKSQGVSESDFPNGLLCLSDGEYNFCGDNVTNFKEFRNILSEAGFSHEFVENFKLVLWDIPNDHYGSNKTKFEDFADAPNCFHISGYDSSAVSFLLEGGEFKSTPKNSRELFEAAMNQELLNLVYPRKIV